MNEHVSVVAGEFLNEDKFPMFGERVLNSLSDIEINEIHTGPSVENKYMDMFEAAPKISQQICKILSIDTNDTIPSLPSLIEDKEVRLRFLKDVWNRAYYILNRRVGTVIYSTQCW